MARTREIACQFYINEGNCSKGRDGEFYGCCQTCKKYLAKAGGRPNRVDRRKEKLERIRRKEKYDY